MMTLLQEYEECEDLFALTDQFVAYGEKLSDMLDNLKVVYHCIEREVSNEGIMLLNSFISLEADMNATAMTEGKVTASKGNKKSALSNAVMKAQSIMGKLREFMRTAGNWFNTFFTKAAATGINISNQLTQRILDIQNKNNNLNYKVRNIYLEVNNATLTPWLGRISGLNSREDLAKMYAEMRNNLESRVVKDTKELSKEDMVNLLRGYSEANKRISSERTTASRFYQSTIQNAQSEKDQAKIKLYQDRMTAAINCANYIVRFIFRNSMKLLASTAQNIKQNG